MKFQVLVGKIEPLHNKGMRPLIKHLFMPVIIGSRVAYSSNGTEAYTVAVGSLRFVERERDLLFGILGLVLLCRMRNHLNPHMYKKFERMLRNNNLQRTSVCSLLAARFKFSLCSSVVIALN